MAASGKANVPAHPLVEALNPDLTCLPPDVDG
jgi:hypothetical protein